MNSELIQTQGLGTREMHVVVLVDCSGSMSIDGRIDQMNHAMGEIIPILQQVQNDQSARGKMYLTAIAFSDNAWSHIEKVPIDQAVWRPLPAAGVTEMGSALRLLSQYFDENDTSPLFRPVVLLVSDGEPTDTIEPSFDAGLQEALSKYWIKSALRSAISVGVGAKKETLEKFTGNPELVFTVHNAQQLRAYVKFATAQLAKGSMKLQSSPGSEDNSPIINIPTDENFQGVQGWGDQVW